MTSQNQFPLEGIKVVEFTHMVMGPSAGLILADLGAEVIKVEPISGDKTRNLKGSGAGYFQMYNRNKKSVCLDLKSAEGARIARQLIGRADVLIENFRPGSMDKLGFSYDQLSKENPGLIYYSAKGFLAGPYENRTALDEVTQMMGGLAYMTGPSGRPLRAGSSVIDVMGGMFGVIGILSALQKRHEAGAGQKVTSSLFESTVFLVGQHMAQYAVTGEPARPMPERISAWAIYDLFETRDNEQVFVAVVSDSQWVTFCREFSLTEFAENQELAANSDRVGFRDEIIPVVQKTLKSFTKAELMEKLDSCGLPFAGIGRPEEMFDDPHLLQSGGLLTVSVPGGGETRLPALPLEMGGQRTRLHHDVPTPGEDTEDVLRLLDYSDPEIEALFKEGIVRKEGSSQA